MSSARNELLREMIEFFHKAKKQILETVLKQHDSIRRVILYGSGDLAQLTFHALEEANIAVIAICDNPSADGSRECCGREVLNPTQVRYMAPDAVVLVGSNREEADPSLAYLQDRGIRLITLDSGHGNCSGHRMQEPAACAEVVLQRAAGH